MSRRRYISTEMGLDPKLKKLAQDCGDFAVLLYTWLIPHAEDDGIIKGNAEVILGRVMPTWRWVEVEKADRALKAMHKLGLLDYDGERAVFPADKFYTYQNYIAANRRRTPQNPAEPHKIPQNPAPHSLSLSHSQSLSHSIDNDRGLLPLPVITEGWDEVIAHWAKVANKLDSNITPNDIKAAKEMVAIAGGDIPCVIRAIDKMIEKQGKTANGLKYYMNPVSEEVALRDVTSSDVEVPKTQPRTSRRKQSTIPGSNRRPEDAKYYADYAKLEEELLMADDDEEGSA